MITNTKQTSGAGLAEQGENVFYSLSREQQKNLLNHAIGRGRIANCKDNCEYVGGLLCEFCDTLEPPYAKEILQKVNQRSVPSRRALKL